MENRNKLLATATDRFTTLPDEIVQHMLSFVEFRDLTRLGAVSKRCYQFYLSTPSFFFNACLYNKNMQRKSKMMDHFDHFLRRHGNSKMDSFRIDLTLPERLSRKLVQVMTWIDTAARCNVEVLNLQLGVESNDPVLGLPSSIFNCESLRSLLVGYCRMSSCRIIEKIFKVPSSTCPNNLQCLNLSYVRIDEGFSNWISSSCKCIKEIKLDYVDTENLSIESSSLESFTFVDRSGYTHLCSLGITGEKLKSIHIVWKFNGPAGSRSLHICAPNLEYLKWVGDLVNHLKLEKLLSLEKAEIVLNCRSDIFCDFHNAFEFLSSICRVKALILSDWTIKALFSDSSMAPVVFDTTYLCINTVNLNNGVVPAMVSLMRGMSNLNTLDIKSDPRLIFIERKESGFNSKYWKSQNLDFVNQLKEATIEVENGTNAWQFARFILENARNLKKVTIFHLPRKEHVIKKVLDSKKVSSAIIDFHQKKRSSVFDYVWFLN